MTAGEALTIPCSDGYRLAGRLFLPAGEARGATVIICPAIFVRQRFYARFAAYLAEQGYCALTFDNRGAGRSLAGEQRGWQHSLAHWGQRDLPAAVAWARARSPDHRLFLVGHSMGGQLVGLSPAIHRLDAVVTVAATSAYWRRWAAPMRYLILAWFGLVPLLGRTMKVFPAGALGLGPDVAAGPVRDWARWGRHACYIHGPFDLRPLMDRYRGRVLAYSFTDDEHLGCGAAVRALHAHFTRAELEHRRVDPEELGLAGLGHFGYFRKEGRPLWDETIAWLQR